MRFKKQLWIRIYKFILYMNREKEMQNRVARWFMRPQYIKREGNYIVLTVNRTIYARLLIIGESSTLSSSRYWDKREATIQAMAHLRTNKLTQVHACEVRHNQRSKKQQDCKYHRLLALAVGQLRSPDSSTLYNHRKDTKML